MAKHYDELKGLGEVYAVLRIHISCLSLARYLRGHQTLNYPMIGDPTGVITRGFGVMIEEEGVALKALSLQTLME